MTKEKRGSLHFALLHWNEFNPIEFNSNDGFTINCRLDPKTHKKFLETLSLKTESLSSDFSEFLIRF